MWDILVFFTDLGKIKVLKFWSKTLPQVGKVGHMCSVLKCDSQKNESLEATEKESVIEIQIYALPVKLRKKAWLSPSQVTIIPSISKQINVKQLRIHKAQENSQIGEVSNWLSINFWLTSFFFTPEPTIKFCKFHRCGFFLLHFKKLTLKSD